MTERTDPAYAFGDSARELERLIHQARFIGDLTREVLVEAGLSPGMRVLDIGCGPGDVSFLAASLVGPAGEVVGVDMSPAAIEVARTRLRHPTPRPRLRLTQRFICISRNRMGG